MLGMKMGKSTNTFAQEMKQLNISSQQDSEEVLKLALNSEWALSQRSLI
jgi:hypothetical protein